MARVVCALSTLHFNKMFCRRKHEIKCSVNVTSIGMRIPDPYFQATEKDRLRQSYNRLVKCSENSVPTNN